MQGVRTMDAAARAARLEAIRARAVTLASRVERRGGSAAASHLVARNRARQQQQQQQQQPNDDHQDEHIDAFEASLAGARLYLEALSPPRRSGSGESPQPRRT